MDELINEINDGRDNENHTIQDNTDNLSISYLLDSEKQEIEKTINEKYNNEVKDEVEKPKSFEKQTKSDIIEGIYSAQETLGIEKTSRNKLNKMTKKELIKLFGELTNQVMAPPQKPSVDKPQLPEEKSGNAFESIANSMFLMHTLLISGIEKTSEVYKEKTYGVNLMDGLSERNLRKKQDFIEIFKKLYAEYKDSIDPVVSPVSLYLMTVTSMSFEIGIENYEKKKQK